MLIRGITLFFYFWVALIIGEGELNLVFRAGDLTIGGLSLLGVMFGLTLFTWGCTYFFPGRPGLIRFFNLAFGGASLGALGITILSYTKAIKYRDFLFVRPWGDIQVIYPAEVHRALWESVFFTQVGDHPGAAGVVPQLGNTLVATKEVALTQAVDFLRTTTGVMPEAPPAGTYGWAWAALGVVALVGVTLVLLAWWGASTGGDTPPPSPPTPGPHWWDHPAAGEVRPRSPVNFTLEDVEAILAKAKPAATAAVKKASTAVTAAPPVEAPVVATVFPTVMVHRARIITAAATAIDSMFTPPAGNTFVNPETSELPPTPRRTRPAGVFTPLSAFPDLPRPPLPRQRPKPAGWEGVLGMHVIDYIASREEAAPPVEAPTKAPGGRSDQPSEFDRWFVEEFLGTDLENDDFYYPEFDSKGLLGHLTNDEN